MAWMGRNVSLITIQGDGFMGCHVWACRGAPDPWKIRRLDRWKYIWNESVKEETKTCNIRRENLD
jgi:hypothetical protein